MRRWTFVNSWVGWEGYGPLTDTHLSNLELFTTLFIQDKQYPHLLTFSIEHKCQHITVWWQRRNVETGFHQLCEWAYWMWWIYVKDISCWVSIPVNDSKSTYLWTWYYILLLTCHLIKEFYVNNKTKGCVWMLCFMSIPYIFSDHIYFCPGRKWKTASRANLIYCKLLLFKCNCVRMN